MRNQLLEPLLPPFIQKCSSSGEKDHSARIKKTGEVRSRTFGIDVTDDTLLVNEGFACSTLNCTANGTCGNAGILITGDSRDSSCNISESLREALEGEDEVEDGYETFADCREWETSFRQDDSRYRGSLSAEDSRERWGTIWNIAKHCESFSTIDENEDMEKHSLDTTEPLLSHALVVRYDHTPRPRFFSAVGRDAEYFASSLPRRPRSPVRDILPEKFNFCAAIEKIRNRIEEIEEAECLRESKNRISRELRRVSEGRVDEETLVSSLVLQTILERVSLSCSSTSLDFAVDIDIFVGIAAMWALFELDIADTSDLNEEQLFSNLKVKSPQIKQCTAAANIRAPKIRGVFQKTYECNLRNRDFIYRCPPWHLVGPMHARGSTRFHLNVRESIDEKLGKTSRQLRSVYVPDLTCFHVRDLPDKTYVAHRRKSKTLTSPRKCDSKDIDGFLIHVVSFN